MSTTAVHVHKGAYLDSLLLMATTVSMEQAGGVQWAGAVMATAKGLQELSEAGFDSPELEGLGANDLVLAVKADDDAAAEKSLAAGREAAFSTEEAGSAGPQEQAPKSIRDAARRDAEVNVAIVSVPGEYAALEAHHALTAGLHVLLFSDGVPLEEEVELKERATHLGRLVMGPGAGTAVLAGTGLGFANSLAGGDSEGSVGIVAAAGTGAQEVAALLDRWGVRVANVIGVGGRDLSEEVDGRMARLAVRALDADASTSAVLLVSKPPSSAVAQGVLEQCRDKPGVAVFLGLDDVEHPSGVRLTPTLEAGALAAASLVGVQPPPPGEGLRDVVAAVASRLSPERKLVRGLFSGGTLCYEAQVVLEPLLGPVHSNEPLRAEHHVPAPDGSHVLLDLGAEEYTRGVPHPMIDPSGRMRMLREVRGDESVAVVLLDVVLGHGAHEDPAGQLAPLCADLVDSGAAVVAYVLGTESDPQVYSRQREKLEQVGCIVPETNARAAYAAAGLALRRPELAEAGHD
jgi:FdrA protein